MSQIKPNSFIWIPDASSSDTEQCKQLFEQECKILITDHHLQSESNPYAIVINNQTSQNVANKDGCGTLVTFKFIQYCCQQQNDKFYKSLIDMVAVANLADVMDMTSLENRCFNHYALNNIKNEFLIALCDEFIKDTTNITPKDIVWSVVPKINAVARGNDQMLKEDMFYAFVGVNTDYDDVISRLKKAHRQQGNITKDIAENILDDVDLSAKIVIVPYESEDNEYGYTGLIANKICSTLNKPVMLVHQVDDEYIGSCRSPFPIKDILSQSNLMTVCAGHESALGVGWKIDDTDKLIEYISALDINANNSITVCNSYTSNSIPNNVFGYFDNYVDLFGEGVKMPLFHVHSIQINGRNIREMGNGSTIKFSYCGVDYIKFFCSKEYRKSIHVGENIELEIEVIGELSINEWNGNVSKQCVIDKMEVNVVGKREKSWEELF